MTYQCDHCGVVLTEGQSLSGLCQSCQRALEMAKRVMEG